MEYSIFDTSIQPKLFMEKSLSLSFQEYQHYTELPEKWVTLVEAARNAINNAYAPYSNFYVGASILKNTGEIFIGANQENASYSLTICAERTALGNYAMHINEDTEYIEAIAVAYTAENALQSTILAPCGACRQHILEYQSKQEHIFPIIFTAINGATIVVPNIEVLLPFSFSKSSLPQK